MCDYGNLITSQNVTAAILFATLVVLIIYTRETWLLRKQAVRQTSIMQRPVVIIDFIMPPSELNQQKFAFNIRNIGFGPAFNITIPMIRRTVDFPVSTVRCNTTFRPLNNVLEKGESGAVYFESTLEGHTDDTAFGRAWWNPRSPGDAVPLLVSFQDAEGTGYENPILIEASESSPRNLVTGPLRRIMA